MLLTIIPSLYAPAIVEPRGRQLFVFEIENSAIDFL